MSETAVATLVTLALHQFGIGVPNTQAVLRVAVRLAEEINKFQTMRGPEKLECVQAALREALKSPLLAERLGTDTQKVLLTVVDDVVPETLSLVIAAGRGNFQLKKPSVGCVAKFLAVFCRVAATVAPPQYAQAAAATSVVATAVASAVAEKEVSDSGVALRIPETTVVTPPATTEPPQ